MYKRQCADTAIQAECRLYENIVDEEKGVYNKEDGSLNLNPNSLTVVKNCMVEPELGKAEAYDSCLLYTSRCV